MTNYQSILTISVKHDYYNTRKDDLAPFDIFPDGNTATLLRQYGILQRSKHGYAQLIVDTELFRDQVNLTKEFNLRFYLVAADPLLRSITKMPDIFDISTIDADFTQSETLNLNVDNWGDSNQSSEVNAHNRNLISILNIHIPQERLNLEKKSLTVCYSSISVYWQYHIFNLNAEKEYNIPSLCEGDPSFTEQDREQALDKMMRVFLSNNEIPLRKIYTQPFSLLTDRKIIINSLPSPIPANISTSLIDGNQKHIAHIYVN